MEISNYNTQYHTTVQSFETENQINLNPRHICSKKHIFTAAPTLRELVDRVR